MQACVSMLAPRLSPLSRGRGPFRAGGADAAGGGRRALSWIVLVYGALGALGALVAIVCGRDPLTTTAWLPIEGPLAACLSLALGVGAAVVTILATRTMVARIAWARQLHKDLRPVVHGADDTVILLTAFASGVGEELFFRGLLVPVAGVWISSAAFGLLHQVRGRARWAWAAWAGIMGLVFAMVFVLTGHLEGAIASHVIINTVNLRFLRDSVPLPKVRALGGLLGR
jgi:membrane protease YdiL (CAAX protease family)